MFFDITIVVSSLWLVCVATLFKTNDFPSHILFKLFPMVLGIILGIFSMKQFGLI